MRRFGCPLVVAALLSAPVSVQFARAVDATWQGPGNDFSNGANWSGGTTPDGIATFTNNGAPTSLVDLSGTTVGTLQFNAGAPAYTIAAGDGVVSINFIINGAGVLNNSGVEQTLVAASLSVLRFTGSADAGNATLSSTGGFVAFEDTATGGTARVVLAGGSSGLAIAGTSGTLSIGSIEGSGQTRFFFNANLLTVGSLGTDTTYFD